MVFSFFRKHKEHHELKQKVNKINQSLGVSFGNIKNDMKNISSWLHTFKGHHDDHKSQFNLISHRLSRLENSLVSLQEVVRQLNIKGELVAQTEKKIEEAQPEKFEEESDSFNNSVWDSLTETQQKICWKLAMLQKELPDQWISLKYLAQELYPERDYNQVRSTISQFISALEELGFVKRRRKGKQAYVFSSKKNPCSKGKKKIKATIKTKN